MLSTHALLDPTLAPSHTCVLPHITHTLSHTASSLCPAPHMPCPLRSIVWLQKRREELIERLRGVQKREEQHDLQIGRLKQDRVRVPRLEGEEVRGVRGGGGGEGGEGRGVDWDGVPRLEFGGEGERGRRWWGRERGEGWTGYEVITSSQSHVLMTLA